MEDREGWWDVCLHFQSSLGETPKQKHFQPRKPTNRSWVSADCLCDLSSKQVA